MVGIAVIVLVAIGLSRSSTLKKSENGQVNKDTSDALIETSVVEPEMEEGYVAWVAELEDVSGGNSKGTGYISRGAKALSHEVMAELPDPVGTDFYEGWLVQQTPTLKFFSTGEMVKEDDGSYSLSFQSERRYEDYNFVVITLETLRDDVPEKHILEGLAKIEGI